MVPLLLCATFTCLKLIARQIDAVSYCSPLFSPAALGEGPLLADYKEHHTDEDVHFDLELVPGKMAACLATAGGLEAKFKLASKISTGQPKWTGVEGPCVLSCQALEIETTLLVLANTRDHSGCGLFACDAS
eukprot:GHRR01033916.1.p1 GENE.GHRR01033916.1~~GHRR01033916.1.p1  ORF type:complete len:132 (+),score=30.55 GHRR01033916.1:192-587(+)